MANDMAMNRDLGSVGPDRIETEEFESALGRIPSVTAARVVVAPPGRIAEVHILARRDRSPKQLVRDVQSVALATFGIEIDYRTVSVVQLDDAVVEGDLHESAPRVALVRLTADVAGHSSEIKVQLTAGNQQLSGQARGPASASMRLVARAVVEGVAGLVGDSALDVDFAEVLPAGAYTVAISILRMSTNKGDQVVSGSAVIRKDGNDAMARATLSALNRLIGGV